MIDTINLVNKEVARKLNHSESLVRQVNKFFWKYGVKETIQSAQYTSVRIPKIGTLVVSRNKVNKKILRIIRAIRSLKNPNRVFRDKTREQCLSDKYDELRLMLQRRNDIAIIYKSNTERKNDKLAKAGLAEQTTDNASSGIQTLLG